MRVIGRDVMKINNFNVIRGAEKHGGNTEVCLEAYEYSNYTSNTFNADTETGSN